MSKFFPIIFKNNTLSLLDQRLLPAQVLYIECQNINDVYTAIKDMVVRGAPCIGFTALYGLTIWAKQQTSFSAESFDEAISYLKSARPTAVNLEFELDKARALVSKLTNIAEVSSRLEELADFEIKDSEVKNIKMAEFVVSDLKEKFQSRKLNILTHCNTGFLACGSVGTALGVIERLNHHNLLNHVYVDETRPYLQGARLTAFELTNLSIDHSVVVEGAASFLMKNRMIDAIVVGADRIALNGDTANKIGTANLSIIAKFYNIAFYVIAPKSSFDFNCASGDLIEVEMRDENEIHIIAGNRITPKESKAFNPSFDITPGELISGISCEDKFLLPPFTKTISELSNV